MPRNVALITGITGQDGAYLTELLLAKGYQVHGLKRRTSSLNSDRVDRFYADPHQTKRKFIMHYADITDATHIARLIKEIEPTEFYNLAAQSDVALSAGLAEYTADANALGTVRLLEAIRLLGMQKDLRFFQSSTAELYGNAVEVPQTESTPFRPKSLYSAAKLYAYWMTVIYRDAYDLHASNGILFNHESPYRGQTFVTRKITQAVAAIQTKRQQTLFIGNLDARRDWGHARDYVEAMWLMLQQDKPEDYVLATGESHSVRDFIEQAFMTVGRSITWRGKGTEEIGLDARSSEVLVRVDPRYFRPTEAIVLVGDSSKARARLAWRPRTSFSELVREMVQSDLELALAG